MPINDSTSSADPIRVLVAWRPDSRGTESLEFAAWLGRTTPIVVRVATTFLRPWPSTSLSKLGGKYSKWHRKEALACDTKVRKALRNAGLPEEQWDEDVSVFSDGTSESVLLTQAAADFGADLMVLGSKAAAPKGRFLAGSTADALLHSSPQPLALAPRAVKLSKRGVTRVNFAYLTGDPEESTQSLYFAASLAQRWQLPLRVLAFSPGGIADDPVNDQLDLAADLTVEWREHSMALLDRAKDSVLDRYPELNMTTDIGSGAGWSGAVESLKWKKGDLICLGSAPPGPIERVFIGSTATDFLGHVQVPVLIHPVRQG
ncbi:universal stress protein [Corynebacterium halotolerans]|uniref:universal stress protein n=1 Tax=Corynebacterium halotolerans TaxID=225326 RepID=UPI003CF46666